MTCSSCKYLNTDKKYEGCVSGYKYYCEKYKTYIDGSQYSCDKYVKMEIISMMTINQLEIT